MASIANSELLEKLSPYNLFYPFNHPQAAVDADFWIEGGDAGEFSVNLTYAARALIADTAQNNDYYIHGNGKYNKCWDPSSTDEKRYSRVNWESKVSMTPDADTLIELGLFYLGALPTDYAEAAQPCAQFFFDHDTVATNWVCRTWHAAEEQTDSGVAATGLQTLSMEWTGASVLFYIDHVLVATHTTRVPINTMASAALIRTEDAGGAAKTLLIKYIDVFVDG